MKKKMSLAKKVLKHEMKEMKMSGKKGGLAKYMRDEMKSMPKKKVAAKKPVKKVAKKVAPKKKVASKKSSAYAKAMV